MCSKRALFCVLVVFFVRFLVSSFFYRRNLNKINSLILSSSASYSSLFVYSFWNSLIIFSSVSCIIHISENVEICRICKNKREKKNTKKVSKQFMMVMLRRVLILAAFVVTMCCAVGGRATQAPSLLAHLKYHISEYNFISQCFLVMLCYVIIIRALKQHSMSASLEGLLDESSPSDAGYADNFPM